MARNSSRATTWPAAELTDCGTGPLEVDGNPMLRVVELPSGIGPLTHWHYTVSLLEAQSPADRWNAQLGTTKGNVAMSHGTGIRLRTVLVPPFLRQLRERLDSGIVRRELLMERFQLRALHRTAPVSVGLLDEWQRVCQRIV